MKQKGSAGERGVQSLDSREQRTAVATKAVFIKGGPSTHESVRRERKKGSGMLGGNQRGGMKRVETTVNKRETHNTGGEGGREAALTRTSNHPQIQWKRELRKIRIKKLGPRQQEEKGGEKKVNGHQRTKTFRNTASGSIRKECAHARTRTKSRGKIKTIKGGLRSLQTG